MDIDKLIYATPNLLKLPLLYNEYPWLRDDIRKYRWVKRLDPPGRTAVTYLGYPCDETGKRLEPSRNHNVVIKVPRIDLHSPQGDQRANRSRTFDDLQRRLQELRWHSAEEFWHITQRLLISDKRYSPCPHANPVIDMCEVPWSGDQQFQLPVTIQPFLDNASPLDRWLTEVGLRDSPRNNSETGEDQSGWLGIALRASWCDVALRIAHALKEIHQRRVTHGDVHPGNIFMTVGDVAKAIFIDFGEAFVATPAPRFRRLRFLRAYHAPELARPGRKNESIDIYSFGILLLYLATGQELALIPAPRLRDHRGRIHELIRARNFRLLDNEPRILDVIGRCTATDPADRPRMLDVCDDLARILASSALPGQPDDWSCCPHSSEHVNRYPLTRLLGALSKGTRRPRNKEQHHPVLVDVLTKEAQELLSTFGGLHTEMVELYGTRDRILRVMISLIDQLQQGDSWTSATTLNVWQRYALGLDGSYGSACIRALQRGAAIRRVFVVSIEELGYDYCRRLNERLARASRRNVALERLSVQWNIACHRYLSPSTIEDSKPRRARPTKRRVEWNRKRFIRVLDYFDQIIKDWHLRDCVNSSLDFNLEVPGLQLSLCPVHNIDEAERIRGVNPAAIMHLPSVDRRIIGSRTPPELIDKWRWLLVAAELRGRHSRQMGHWPVLVGLRVHPSVQGVPLDRLTHMVRLFNEESTNIGGICGQLRSICDTVAKEPLTDS